MPIILMVIIGKNSNMDLDIEQMDIYGRVFSFSSRHLKDFVLVKSRVFSTVFKLIEALNPPDYFSLH
jgi:hypothetical protein